MCKNRTEKFKEYFTKNIDTFGELNNFILEIILEKNEKKFDLVLLFEIHIIG